jgi:pimeloyl-ACP methyl ester carboxylesterase
MAQATVTLHSKPYAIKVSGTGEQPILIIGIGTLLDRTTSSNIREHFTFYFSDLYWDGKNSLDNPSMDSLANDIQSTAIQLRLETKPIIMAHSAYGPLALHAANVFPDDFAGVMMIGSPPGWNANLVESNDVFFQKHASEERKKADTEYRNCSDVSKQTLDKLDPYEKFLRLYSIYDRARYWKDFSYDSRFLWDGLDINMPIFNTYFEKLLPLYNITENIDQVTCPVFLAAGQYDYDCCPKERWN